MRQSCITSYQKYYSKVLRICKGVGLLTNCEYVVRFVNWAIFPPLFLCNSPNRIGRRAKAKEAPLTAKKKNGIYKVCGTL